jgi:hypothetical protein
MLSRKSKAIVVGMLSAGAMLMTATNASATTINYPGQIGNPTSGCIGEYGQSDPVNSGYLVSGEIYTDRPSGIACQVTIDQYWRSTLADTGTSDVEAANGPGSSVWTKSDYFGATPSDYLCVEITWGGGGAYAKAVFGDGCPAIF